MSSPMLDISFDIHFPYDPSFSCIPNVCIRKAVFGMQMTMRSCCLLMVDYYR